MGDPAPDQLGEDRLYGDGEVRQEELASRTGD
jgi:hypothetical protein